jgi:hypothetical protein
MKQSCFCGGPCFTNSVTTVLASYTADGTGLHVYINSALVGARRNFRVVADFKNCVPKMTHVFRMLLR